MYPTGVADHRTISRSQILLATGLLRDDDDAENDDQIVDDFDYYYMHDFAYSVDDDFAYSVDDFGGP